MAGGTKARGIVNEARDLIDEIGDDLDGAYYEAPDYMLEYVEAGCEVTPLLELEVVLIVLTEVK